ncbi:MAG: DUF3810 family protein [Planctomycetota bacterium]
MNDEPTRRFPRLTWAAGAATCVAVLGHCSPAAWIEAAYCRGAFPYVQALLVPASGLVPMPLMGVILATVPILLPIYVWRRWRRAKASGTRSGRLLRRGAWRTAQWLLIVYALFLVAWGLGYRRVPIETRWQLPDRALTSDDVHDVAWRLLAVLHRDHEAASRSTGARAWAAIAAAEQALVRELEGWTPALPRHIKHPPDGLLMAIGIYGVISPLTLEANVDPALPTPMRLGISGHELAHLLGYCGEADANVVAFVSGLRADDPLARYGTALTMVPYVMSRRHAREAQRFYALLPQAARDDLAALHAKRQRLEVAALSQVTSAVNDRYLKSRGVELGTNDYARGFTLFVRVFQKGLVPLPEPLASAEVEAPRPKGQ